MTTRASVSSPRTMMIDRLIEDAAMAGLCRDGQRDYAIDALISKTDRAEHGTIADAVDDRLRELRANG